MDMNGFFYELDQLLADNQLEKAEAYMKETLEKAEKDGDNGAIITICNELGGFYRALSRYAEGVALYEKALAVIRELKLEGSEHHGTTLINYAATLTMTGQVPEALELYSVAVEIFSGPGFALDYRLATLYNNMSFLCMDLGHYEEAETSLTDALYILNILDDSEIDKAISYTNLSSVYLALDRLDEAKVAVKNALDIFIGETGGKDVHYAAAVSALADVYSREENWEKAASLYEEALQLTHRDYGEVTHSCAILYDNLSVCAEKMGNAEAAAEYTRKSTEILKEIGL